MFLHGPVRAGVALYASVQVDEGGVAVGEGVVPNGVETAAFGDGGGYDVTWLLVVVAALATDFFLFIWDEPWWKLGLPA